MGILDGEEQRGHARHSGGNLKPAVERGNEPYAEREPQQAMEMLEGRSV
jgi:hypothetical protein